MSDIRTILSQLRRPSLLMRAARLGLGDYRRERDLRRLVGPIVSAEKVVTRLMDEEERLETHRVEGRADYSLSHHIEVLIALMAEMHLLPRGPRAV
ncbi:DUF6477 family protein [Fuscibacter oryzae]|uniref:Uncharacterized protein n=1 Tax=Fuscibacter oryzae TaxID=2803939 RepID=A0A8J7SRA6_9RHOB|nr:DUF6477 family protein [Fuscibacter oryzae]MBL4927456.1 hypothetical protein [Fuscibacter oryzae]